MVRTNDDQSRRRAGHAGTRGPRTKNTTDTVHGALRGGSSPRRLRRLAEREWGMTSSRSSRRCDARASKQDRGAGWGTIRGIFGPPRARVTALDPGTRRSAAPRLHSGPCSGRDKRLAIARRAARAGEKFSDGRRRVRSGRVRWWRSSCLPAHATAGVRRDPRGGGRALREYADRSTLSGAAHWRSTASWPTRAAPTSAASAIPTS